MNKIKYRFQGMAIGIIISIIAVTSITGYAANISKTIKVIFNSVIVNIDGKNLGGDKINYNNNIYVNIKNIADLLGKEYKYDNKKGIINVDTKKPDYSKNSLGSRKNPANLNKTISLSTKLYNGNSFESLITLKEIIRGDEAWAKIKAANMFNKEPSSGYECILAKFNFKLTNASNEDVQFDLNNCNFTLISEEGKDYESYSCVLPNPQINAKLYSGASNEGWVAFQVKSTDHKPLIAYGKGNDGTGGIWFKGYNDSSATNNTSSNNSEQKDTDNTTVLNNTSDIKNYLNNNYSSLNTSVGKTNFSYDIMENTNVIFPYDYWIMVKYDTQFFYDIKYSIKYSNEEKSLVKKELKDFQEKLAKDLISKIPTKKLYGGYYDSWYKYPNLKIDLQTRHYYSWINYNEPSFSTDIKNTYESTKPSSFKWYTLIDDEL